MTALAKKRTANPRRCEALDLPVAGGVMTWQGGYVVFVNGYLRPASAALGLCPMGKASESVDNRLGSDGDLRCHVDFLVEKNLFPMIGSGFAQSDMGKLAYLADDQTVTPSSTGATPLGTAYTFELKNGVQVVYIEPGDPGAMALLSSSLSTIVTLQSQVATLQSQVAALQGDELWTSASGTFSATARQYNVDLSSVAGDATLPASPATGESHAFKDDKRKAATHNLTIRGNGHNIEQLNGSFAATFVVSTDGTELTFEFDGTNWVIV